MQLPVKVMAGLGDQAFGDNLKQKDGKAPSEQGSLIRYWHLSADWHSSAAESSSHKKGTGDAGVVPG
ncbi:hypothetical protein E5F05_07275 [Deinococcus metallilatus]|uniref:Uncharacterized protein n=1 Tax=Deinococcus metallilatus TaxID=1211322 RepID=A0AAJ5F0Z5_9DEIO|nr:hypothetical protein [Deinococcus metallilatus]MBB5297078.1 hypothetical protein [Deinococcus metallilatus]QBY07771.1 hypothetical protein E5F05_07275 [Deinococcus metallilatus]RXJ13471.1 hypothetical protein ERJ73_06110 [Deinococcus metallilatus]TLK22372.1 hypothetical protein FCS05_17890 [Deinococcus metallilatus]GMA17330.1 hypothetical protein GCM10025871_36610 [Deinococcus metallilatus]